MGVVWRAIQLGLERPVAIKMLAPSYMRNPEARLRFTREARVAASLQHPNVVSVLDFGIDGETSYLVMELLVGGSLRERLQSGAVSIGEASVIGAEVSTALIAAHRINLVHRDIKPENIFMELSEGIERVRVVDFGLAFIEGGDESLGRLTSDGILSGTPAYMSPEQVKGQNIGPASDVYSLACMLYELMVGRTVYSGAATLIMTRHAFEPPLSMRRAAPHRGIDPILDELVMSMLSKSPLLRPPLDRVKATLDTFAGNSTSRIGRSGASVADRSSRMVPIDAATESTHLPEPIRDATPVQLSWVGEDDEELALGLASNDIERTRDAPTTGAIAYAPGSTLDDLKAMVARGICVVTDVDVDDIVGITDRLRAGVADVVTRPVRADDLARKIRRAHGKAAR